MDPSYINILCQRRDEIFIHRILFLMGQNQVDLATLSTLTDIPFRRVESMMKGYLNLSFGELEKIFHALGARLQDFLKSDDEFIEMNEIALPWLYPPIVSSYPAAIRSYVKQIAARNYHNRINLFCSNANGPSGSDEWFITLGLPESTSHYRGGQPIAHLDNAYLFLLESYLIDNPGEAFIGVLDIPPDLAELLWADNFCTVNAIAAGLVYDVLENETASIALNRQGKNILNEAIEAYFVNYDQLLHSQLLEKHERLIASNFKEICQVCHYPVCDPDHGRFHEFELSGVSFQKVDAMLELPFSSPDLWMYYASNDTLPLNGRSDFLVKTLHVISGTYSPYVDFMKDGIPHHCILATRDQMIVGMVEFTIEKFSGIKQSSLVKHNFDQPICIQRTWVARQYVDYHIEQALTDSLKVFPSSVITDVISRLEWRSYN